MSRPLIGITCYVEPASRGDWKDVPSVVLPHDYVRQVEAAGGTILVIPPRADADDVVARDIVSRIDGLVIAGGADVDPDRYAAPERHPEVQEARHDRDAMEIALATAAAEADLPLLGICRGMQLLNVALGGTLIQHLPDDLGHCDHRRHLGSFDNADHDVRLAPGSIAAEACGELLHTTKSHHHQAVDRLGDGLAATGWSVLDDLVEAIEVPDARWALGVQWHPEVDPRSGVVAALVGEAVAAKT